VGETDKGRQEKPGDKNPKEIMEEGGEHGQANTIHAGTGHPRLGSKKSEIKKGGGQLGG